MSFILNINEKEEQLIETLIGDSKKMSFAGIAEILISAPEAKEKWDSLVKPGVVCFVRDLDKKTFFLQVINMKKGTIAWNQNIDNHVVIQRRRRWIFVLETGYRKVLLNFVDDCEADAFSMVLSKYFPQVHQIRRFPGVMPYTITENGRVVRNKKPFGANERKENLKMVVKMVGLPEHVLDDPDFGPTILDIYEQYGSDLEEELDILEDTYGSDYEEILGDYYDEEDDYGDFDSPLLPETTPSESPSLQKSATWSRGADNKLHEKQESSRRIMSDPTPDSPITNTPPPPPPIKPQSTASNKPPIHIKRPSIRRSNPQMSLQDQIRNPCIKLRSVNGSNRKGVKGKTGSPCLSDALLGAMNKIRMATRDSDLYGVIDEEKIYQEREDDW